MGDNKGSLQYKSLCNKLLEALIRICVMSLRKDKRHSANRYRDILRMRDRQLSRQAPIGAESIRVPEKGAGRDDFEMKLQRI
jgi:hypothetical protein